MEKVDSYPLVTVVIPTYNRSSLLKKAIGSVLAQTFPHFELIIADDGSTDDTKEMVNAIDDPRIQLLELGHTGHIGKVRNAGARAGKGDWIAFLDSDDQWLPIKLEQQLKRAKETRGRWLYSNFELIDETGNPVPPKAGLFKPYSGWITDLLLANEATAVICTLLIERNLFEEINGLSEDERLAFRGDYELVIRLSMKAVAIAMPETLVRVLEHPGRATHSLKNAHEKSAIPYTIFIEQNGTNQLRQLAKKRKGYLLSEAAVNRSMKGERGKAFRHLADSIGKDEWRHWFSSAWKTMKASVNHRKKLNHIDTIET